MSCTSLAAGIEWSPQEIESPHKFDFKTILTDDEARLNLIRSIRSQHHARPCGDWSLRLTDFEPPFVSYRKFADSADKRGFFVQAGCIITDGFGRRDFSHVLVVDRSKIQFHDSKQTRYQSGFSCVVGTVFASAITLDPFGHAPAVVFNDIRAVCPWAIFSRKLLLPDVYVESRFLGLGYRLDDEARQYIFLTWHVRTGTRPDVMLVDARRRHGDFEHDRAFWLPRSRLDGLQLLPVDQSAVDALQQPDKPAFGDEKAGLVRVPAFQDVHRSRWRYTTVSRDAIILDLLRMIQRDLHSLRTSVSLKRSQRREDAFHAHVYHELQRHITELGLNAEIQYKSHAGWGPGGGQPDLVVTIADADGKRLFKYIIELKVDSRDSAHRNYLAQVERYRTSALNPCKKFGHLGTVDAVILVLGIWPRTPKDRKAASDVVAIESDITIPHAHAPVHVIRIHLDPPSPSKTDGAKEIAHALIPIALGSGKIGFLFVKGPNDPGFQPIGGKIEGFESADLAVRRELEEETRVLGKEALFASDVQHATPLFPASTGKAPGLSLTMMSPTMRRITTYRFHPFLIELFPKSRERLAGMLDQLPSSLKVFAIDEWLKGQKGYDPAYAKAVAPMLTDEYLTSALVKPRLRRY